MRGRRRQRFDAGRHRQPHPQCQARLYAGRGDDHPGERAVVHWPPQDGLEDEVREGHPQELVALPERVAEVASPTKAVPPQRDHGDEPEGGRPRHRARRPERAVFRRAHRPAREDHDDEQAHEDVEAGEAQRPNRKGEVEVREKERTQRVEGGPPTPSRVTRVLEREDQEQQHESGHPRRSPPHAVDHARRQHGRHRDGNPPLAGDDGAQGGERDHHHEHPEHQRGGRLSFAHVGAAQLHRYGGERSQEQAAQGGRDQHRGHVGPHRPSRRDGRLEHGVAAVETRADALQLDPGVPQPAAEAVVLGDGKRQTRSRLGDGQSDGRRRPVDPGEVPLEDRDAVLDAGGFHRAALLEEGPLGRFDDRARRLAVGPIDADDDHPVLGLDVELLPEKVDERVHPVLRGGPPAERLPRVILEPEQRPPARRPALDQTRLAHESLQVAALPHHLGGEPDGVLGPDRPLRVGQRRQHRIPQRQEPGLDVVGPRQQRQREDTAGQDHRELRGHDTLPVPEGGHDEAGGLDDESHRSEPRVDDAHREQIEKVEGQHPENRLP